MTTVNSELDGRRLILVFEDGLKANGEPKYFKKSIPNISTEINNDAIHKVGESLAGLCSLTLSSIVLDEDYVLTQAE